MPIDQNRKKHSQQDQRSPVLLMPMGFAFFGIGAFFITMPGMWIWLGGICWLLCGVSFAAGLIKTEAAPQIGPDERQALHQQLEIVDRKCEELQDRNWELREAEQKYRALLESQGDVILHIADNSDRLYANTAYDLYFDENQADLPFRTEQGTLAEAGAVPGDASLWEREIETRQGSRTFRWSETIIRSAHSDRTSRLIIARDITAFKKVKAASEAKSRFLATISHEMRTPLNGIIGMATLLESTSLNDEQTTYNQALRQSGTSLLALVNDVLDLSRIEAGKLTITPEWVSPARMLEDVVELLAPDAQEKGLSIASWIGDEVPGRILVDPVRTRQILINLLGNAVKFTEKGAINLALDGNRPDNEAEVMTLNFSVRDTGPGIEQAMQERLFEEFEQADATRARRHEGTGLGLAISRRLARMMEGDIELASQEGKGSTFTLALQVPWLLTTSDELKSSPDVASLANRSLVGIDLTEADRRALYAYCREWGLNETFLTLAEWQQRGLALAPDHLLINGADPAKAAAIIESFDPLSSGTLTRPLPKSRVIFLEPSERQVIPQMRDCGISGYLVKPIRKASLLSALLGKAEKKAGQGGVSEVLEMEDKASIKTKRTDDGMLADRPTILLVEDNDINALVARRNLQKAGMEVQRAVDGAEALALYESRNDPERDSPFDLVLIDLHMPDMDGLSLFDAMQERDLQRGSSVPKVAFTADALGETRNVCLAHGFDDYLLKPVEPDHLIASVKALL